jgi:pimeloyl-ACP methyl ester carboxylesterase
MDMSASTLLAPPHEPEAFPSHRIAGTALRYACRGRGEPVLLAHGTPGDLRTLLPAAERLADRFEAIVMSLPALGAAERPERPFGTDGQAEDLRDLAAALGRGPVHIAAWSYSAHAALTLAVRHPECVKSLFLFEPSFPTFIEDAATLEAIGADMAAAFEPVAEAFAQGRETEALRRAIDAAALEEGYFDRQPPALRAVHEANAFALRALFTQQPPTPLSAADLARIACPVTIARGGETRTCYRLVTDAAARLVPRARHAVVFGAGHLLPEQDPALFALLVGQHLAFAASDAASPA